MIHLSVSIAVAYLRNALLILRKFYGQRVKDLLPVDGAGRSRFDTEDVFIAIGLGEVGDVPLVAMDDPTRAAQLVEETLRRAGGGVTRETFVTTMNAILRREASR